MQKFQTYGLYLPEGGPDTPLRLCLSPVTAFVPLWPGCVITWDGPGRLQIIPGDEARRWEEVGTEKRFSGGKASEATKMLLPQSKFWNVTTRVRG